MGGLADSADVFVATRLGQGIGAALTLPAALPTLAATFGVGRDGHRALGVWSAESRSASLGI
jgi:hypothetical protein